MNVKTKYIKLPDGNIYEIIPPAPTETERGGILASTATDADTVEVKLGSDGKLYVPTYPDGSGSVGDIGGVEITSGEPTKESTVMTLDPNAEDIELYTVPEIDEKFDALGGGVEITSGEPTKSNTVITLNQNAPKIKIYTAEEIDEMFMGNSSGSSQAIIEVNVLPTENIREDVFYRLKVDNAYLVRDGEIIADFVCHSVDTLPDVGEPVTTDMSDIYMYYERSTDSIQGYINDVLSSAVSIPSGWYDIAMLATFFNLVYGGVITDSLDSTNNSSAIYILIVPSIYYNKQGDWSRLNMTNNTTASGYTSHAEGDGTTASGFISHAEGQGTEALGDISHAEGWSTEASGDYSHAEGYDTTANGDYSHAEGIDTTASGVISHAEGQCTTASGFASHAEGNSTTASGDTSHAEGQCTEASGDYSHAEGFSTIASGEYSHVQGRCNIPDETNKYAHIVGNGEHNIHRSNAHTIDWEGNAWYQGDIYVGGEGQDDENAVKVATEDYVNNLFGSYITDISSLIGGIEE